MTESENAPERFSSRFEVVIYTRPAGDPPENWREEDWRELDRGPGYFTLPAGQVASVRIHGIDDQVLRELVEEIAACPSVRELGLAENRNVTDVGIARLTALPQVVSLNLSSCSLTNEGLATLASLRQLVRLNLSYCNRVTDPGIKMLKSLPNLRYLDLQGAVKVTNGSIAQIRRANLVIHRP
jgi:hypothetical protein